MKFDGEELLAILLALNHINHYYKCGIIYETEKDHKRFIELELKLRKYLNPPEQEGETMSKLDEVKAEIEKLNKEHEEKIAELMATLEEPEYKRRRAEMNEPYYCICAAGFVKRMNDYRSSSCDYDYDTGNYFKTKEEAELHKKKLIAYQTIKDDAKGFEPDWSDEDHDIYYGFYCDATNSLLSMQDEVPIAPICFATEDDVKESQKKHEAEWKLLLGVEDEADR